MASNVLRPLALAIAAALALSAGAAAQGALTLPPDGDNERSWATQQIGLVKVSIEYSSPDVHSPTGEDRAGKIWGDLVPFGLANLNFGTCGDQCPWRGGANENTVFTTTHDVEVQGQPLKAGAYGLHFIPGAEEWTLIFSQDSTAWGSFFYDAKRDVLRVPVKPAKNDYHEFLAYEFTERRPERATLALMWENLKVPFTIAVKDPTGLYVENLRHELRNSPGFTWQSWNAAAQFCLQNKANLEEAEVWAQKAVSLPFIGQENFATLLTLSQLQAVNGRAEEAKKTADRALAHRTAGPIEIHTYARQLLGQKKTAEAVATFELNARRYPDTWPVELGLARARAAQGKLAEALAHARKALPKAPDDANRKSIEGMIQKLEKGEAL